MSEVLRGTATGGCLANLTAEAKRLGLAYFGTECQLVQIFEATANPDDSFTAAFATQVSHRIEKPPYGPNKCRDCGTSFYGDPPRAARPVNPPPLGATAPTNQHTQEDK
ncbi:hypothetical protein [Galactobacter valiniphilus]|uniref:hypothetical protein n=1 Tax=Galactobacter valiniphilus TaxID=2676122 RepID=UPI003736D8E3